ncbi:glycoside hydrolase family 43 protein [Allonocardiopsis opalescens]|uniref:Alpha-L-arabinofuranosidase B-like protein n=1 Tax=Allonocardiopsis opalescens TaxID=1144618 RepID=A0A2T0PYX0_9ACTN|nr:glycoside hydrolase family 43 protein [Allonocardiopsis opalescens]PRX96745.1 alpha-L-arabinofuranosidase B-like protein [Allonocardiopsis opalescens]
MLERRTLLSLGASSLVLAGLGTAPRAASAAPAPAYQAYVMGYFTESPSRLGDDYGLHLAVSTDGLHWIPLNQNEPVATPTAGTGGLRDPFIIRRQDGGFAVIATDLRGTDFTQQNQYIHAWDSADLRSFTGYRRLRMHGMPTHTWAPEAFWDAARGRYGIIYSANSGGRDALWVNYTADFVTVSQPQLFFDPGFNVLDGTMHVTPRGNYLYYKSFADGRLYGARSATLDPRSFDSGTYTSGVISGGIEAPIVAKANDRDEWFLWGDSFSPVNGEFYVWRSTDVAAGNWSPLSKAEYTQPLNAKHATIAPITAAEHAALLARWGAPAWNRIKSYNFPDHLIRHADHTARIDPYPFDPYADAQWRLVPGRADASGLSFQSVNLPDHFLRHSGHVLVLARDDGSAAFAADATFHRVPGLADSAWTSFRSHNFPDRYIRHSGYQLRTDPVTTGSSAMDRQDATFQIGH